MNKQRKVLITITYNEMGIIIDTKAEEVAQPNCNQLATDCIGRQAAIDLAHELIVPNKYKYGLYNQAINNYCVEIMQLPPAQPEIIHCGDCRYKDDGINEYGTPFLKCLHGRSYGDTRINDFCSWAERRTDG